MENQEVKTLSEMVRVTSEWSDRRGLYCYRGQSDKKWGLVPTVFRHLAEKYQKNDEVQVQIISQEDISDATDIEIHIYEQFRERARAYKNDRVNWDNPWEMLCLAQHFGIPTRLLDWTSNLLVAAYFAVEDLDEKKDGVIWSFNIPKFLGEASKKYLAVGGHPLDRLPKQNITFLQKWWLENLPHSVPEPRKKDHLWLIQPPDIDDRMKLQSGFFTIYVSIGETKDDDFVWSHSQWFDKNKPNLLRKLMIPGNCKRNFRDQLWRMGITHNTLFPGLSGLGQHLTALQKEWVRQS